MVEIITVKLPYAIKGCGHKKRYWKIEFFRQNNFVEIFIGIKYDLNRNNQHYNSVYNLSNNNLCIYIYI